MAKVYSFSVPNNEKVVDDVLKIIGRTPLSEVVVDSLKLYKNKALLGEESCVDKIPNWKIWKQLSLTMKDEQIDEAIGRLEHLIKISKAIKKFNSGVLRAGVDF